MRGLLVTGTDTGVGKTAVAAGILAVLRDEGVHVAGFKPAETGHPPWDWPPDATCLAEAAGGGFEQDEVVPYVFEEALAPAVAARRAEKPIDPSRLDEAYNALARRHDLTVVEGAGGLLVPVTDGMTFADLADRWRLPLLIVARPGLGTLNHTALTVDAARSRGLDVLGVVVNGFPADPDTATKTNPEEISRMAPLLGVIPRVDVDTAAGRWEAMRAAVRGHVDLAPLRSLVSRAA